MKPSSEKPVSLHEPRRSACGERSKAAETAYLRSLSVADRITLALTLKNRLNWLKPEVRKS